MVQFNTLAVSAILALGASVSAAPAATEQSHFESLPFDAAILEAALANPEAFGVPEVDVEEPRMSLFSTASAITSVEPSHRVNSTTDEDLTKRSIFGNDDRVYWPNTEYPYSAMGRVEMSTGSWCSASLIGPRVVATARHCYKSGVGYRFQPAFNEGERLGSSAVTTVIKMGADSKSDCTVAHDWAIFVIQDRLGDKNGYLGAKVIDKNKHMNKAIVYSYGYPQDKSKGRKPYRQEKITIKKLGGCEDLAPFRTNADSIGGQSGSAVYIKEDSAYWQIGVHYGSSSEYASAASGTTWVNAVSNARKNYA